ncbi:hypothetical protein Dtox_3890 [Desulfofarcimen acetoxidans DSM 771]|uniref:Uncharacterized protein n=1 Tax=Desulfofarcimen acetoxidans (strain ATCC 49208 / DSM 771 / KCTC 5769 / VKM B-1644 / 5575) TaxID=485916 RepID=C8VXV5_DESAS|nr:hypothetical protein Dtox_3890 [Desulfofarcimen acetoxidans DSM 771]
MTVFAGVLLTVSFYRSIYFVINNVWPVYDTTVMIFCLKFLGLI